MKPRQLEVHEHDWNDGWNSHTVIRAIFAEMPTVIPDGWRQATRYEYLGEIAFLKHFPYGTAVVNDRIVGGTR